MASPVETQQAFLEGHALAFEWFGGVFAEVRYDNLASAVKKVLRGRRRVETDRFIALALALPVRVDLHDSGDRGRAREGRGRGRGRAGSAATTSFRSRTWRVDRGSSTAARGCVRERTWPGRSPAGAGRSPSSSRASGRCCARCPRTVRRRPSEHTVRGSMRRRWSRSVRTGTRSRSRWPGCGSARDRRDRDPGLHRDREGRPP